MSFGTITSTESTFGSISGSIVGAVPGTLSGSVGVPGPIGPVGPAGPQGPQGIPGVGGAWGSIVGTLSAQGDLWSALSSKYDASNPNGFITSTALVPYITSATAASTYQPLSGMTAYLTTASAASTYAPIAAGLPTGGTVGQVLTKNSGTAGDASFQTLIPGDRYVTTSTSSLTVSNGIKNLTIGTGLAYTPNQDVTISLTSDPTLHHMHGQVTAYNSGTGAMTVDVQNHTGSGTYSAWTVNVGGIVPLQTVEWGEVLGNLGDQTDLATALGNKLETSDAASTYQTIAGMSSYLTTADAATTYYLNTNPDAFITASALTGYATESFVTSQGYITSSALSPYLTSASAASTYAALAGATFTGEIFTVASTTSNAGLTITPGVAPTSPTNGEIWATTNDLQVRLNGVTETVAEQSWVTAQGYLTSAPVTSVAGKTGAVSLVVGDVSGAAALSGATFTGLVNTVASTTTTAGLNIPHGVAPTSPVNGDIWTTTSGLFARINAGTQQFAPLGSNNTFSNASSTYGSSTATGTIGLASGATISGSTKTLNIGTGGVSGSTTLTTIGPVLGASTTSIGNTTATSTLNLATGATLTATTKAVNIGTSGVAGSTTNIAIGSTTGTSTTTLQGITNGVTQSAGDSSLKLATTAFVTTADNLKADLESPTFSGTPSLPTGTTAVTQTAGNNTTQIATTAFVTAADNLKANIDSPSLTGTPVSVTSSLSNRSTQIATMEAVKNMIWHPGAKLNYSIYEMQSIVSGTGATFTAFPPYSMRLRGASNVAGSALVRTNNSSINSNNNAGLSRGANNGDINWSKPVWFSFRMFMDTVVSTEVFRATIGKATGAAVGDLSNRGIGIKITGQGFVVLQVHNGTTLTDVTSSFQTVLYQNFDVEVFSDGSGNVTLFVNGSSVATTTAGPTTKVSTGGMVQLEVVTAGGAGGQSTTYVHTLKSFFGE